jgi:hypothetical protein
MVRQVRKQLETAQSEIAAFRRANNTLAKFELFSKKLCGELFAT